MEQEKMSLLILKLKQIYADNNLTVQEIYHLLEVHNDHVSINTIKKVFSPGSENLHFNYANSIQPIARILIALFESFPTDDEISMLRDAIQARENLIDELRERIDFLLNQIEIKDKRIDALMSMVSK